jgi:gamma-glutamyltranspeptidase/glutathione hydrolase
MENGGALHLESGIAPEVLRGLDLRGHRLVHDVGGYGGYQGIWIDELRGVLIGATESRKDGVALGY